MHRGGIPTKSTIMARTRSSKVVFKDTTAYFDDANEAKLIRSLIQDVEDGPDLPEAEANKYSFQRHRVCGYPLGTVVSNATLSTQGYYGLLTNFYFVGSTATTTTIDEDQVGQWVDVEFTVDPLGTFDQRPLGMKEANTIGHTGTAQQVTRLSSPRRLGHAR